MLAARSDRKVRIALMKIYKRDPVRWINDFCVTFDPRAENDRLMPFMLFPRQVEFVRFLQECLRDRESGLVEKSRDVGASWLCCAFAVWLWLFHPGSTVGFGSRKAEYVDKPDDPKAIFPKMRQILQNLPPWMMPEGFKWNEHSTHMKLVNPANLSTITGEAGDNIGRGGRTTIFFKDESAHYENPESIEAALGDNTNVQIDISSVNGTANVFYRRRMAGQDWYPDVPMEKGRTRVFIFDWRHHPGKTQEWYDARRAKWESEGLLHIFAQEVDRDYSGSISNVIIPAAWVKAAIDAHIKLGFGDDGEKMAGQDLADEGGDKNALVVRHGVVLRYAEHWGGEAGDAPSIALPTCVEMKVNDLYYDSIGVGSAFKTTIKQKRENGTMPPGIRVHKWNAGAEVLDPDDPIIPDDPDSPLNKDQYGNLKAQAWWRLRTRFYKTYRAITKGESYDSSELISLDSKMPRIHELARELSQAVHKANGKGKTIVDKKPKGATSPNLADAAVICYNPTREVSILDVLD